jgi:hypothetical protein
VTLAQGSFGENLGGGVWLRGAATATLTDLAIDGATSSRAAGLDAREGSRALLTHAKISGSTAHAIAAANANLQIFDLSVLDDHTPREDAFQAISVVDSAFHLERAKLARMAVALSISGSDPLARPAELLDLDLDTAVCGIEISGQMMVGLRRARFQNVTQASVFVTDQSRLVLEDADLIGVDASSSVGIRARYQAQVQVANVRLEKFGNCAVLVPSDLNAKGQQVVFSARRLDLIANANGVCPPKQFDLLGALESVRFDGNIVDIPPP